MEEDNKGTALSNVIRIDDDRVKEHLDKVVRGTVEETLNAMLEAEAGRLCNAGRYERSEARARLASQGYWKADEPLSSFSNRHEIGIEPLVKSL